jgi:hypothetical protein
LRQSGRRIAEGTLFDLGEIACLAADAGGVRGWQCTERQDQKEAPAPPFIADIRAAHGA